MINYFKDKETEKIWKQEYSKKLPKDIQRIGLRKLIIRGIPLTGVTTRCSIIWYGGLPQKSYGT
jgi:anaerobic selenocysteine-containing dehydrogenase